MSNANSQIDNVKGICIFIERHRNLLLQSLPRLEHTLPGAIPPLLLQHSQLEPPEVIQLSPLLDCHQLGRPAALFPFLKDSFFQELLFYDA